MCLGDMKPDDWSNIAYVIGGLYLLMNFSPVPGVALMLLAIGSFIAHLKGGKWWVADWVGMYLTFGAIITHNLELSWLWLVPVAGIAYKWGTDNYPLFAALWTASVVASYLAGVAITIPLILFGVGLICQRAAEASDDHESETYQILHSIWHVLTMVAIILLVA